MRQINFYLPEMSAGEALRLLAASPQALIEGSRGHRARDRFEQAWRARHGAATDAIAFPSGRSAITACLLAVGTRPGDEVLATGFTCAAVAEGIMASGAKPVWVDIDPATFALSPEALERAITPRSRAVLVQHTFGLSGDLRAIHAVARRRGLRVIGDAALAVGSQAGGAPLVNFGDAAVVSFELSKTISAGWGGLVQTNDAAMAAGLRRVRDGAGRLGRAGAASRLAQAGFSKAVYSPGLLRYAGYPAAALFRARCFRDSSSHTSPSQAGPGAAAVRPYMAAQAGAHWAVLESQLSRLDAVIASHRVAVERYAAVLTGRGVATWLDWRDAGAVMIRYPIVARDRGRMAAWFGARGIELGRWFDYAISPAPVDPAACNYIPGQCQEGERLARHVVNLPAHTRLAGSDLDAVCDALDGYLRAHPDELEFIADWPRGREGF